MAEKKMKPIVTIYTVAYNSEKFIAQAIDSVLAQTYTDFELLIVDDGSTDKTEQIAKSYSDDRIRYIHQEHKNFAAGMNRAITEARGEYILGVDSDDFIAPDYLQKMVACAEQYPDSDYFYPSKLTIVDERGNLIGAWDYQDFSDNNALVAFLLDKKCGPIPNPGSLKRKSLFERVGLYEELETCEDFAFLCKNVLSMRFVKVNDNSDYFYRNMASGNSHKIEGRKIVHAKALEYLEGPTSATPQDKSKLLICSPWDNCWLRYYERYFGDRYEVKRCIYDSDVSQTKDMIAWADVILFNWSDWFLKYWSNQDKPKGKKYIAFLRSYEIWDTNTPWQINWSNIDHLIFVNNAIRQCFLANAKEHIEEEFKTPTHCIPNGIDLDEWKFADRVPNRNIAFVAEIGYKKGIQLLTQFAFSIPYDCSIFPAGRPAYARSAFYFDYITKTLRVDNKIAPVREYDNVQEFLTNKSFILCTSIVEGHPNSLLEAMAVGIKPIIHNWPGSKDLFPEKFIWNTVDEAVEILNGDYQPTEYRAFIEANYDMRKVYKKIEELF